MKEVVLHIKNMVCPRCIKAIGEILKSLNVEPIHIELGKVTLDPNTTENLDLANLSNALEKEGFELLHNQSVQQINEIKSTIIDLIYSGELSELNLNLSALLSEKIGKDYSYLSHLFSSVEGITIERFFILQKTERAKELITYGQLSMKEIAFQLGYSSTAHFSRQFKNTIGLTPTEFKNNRDGMRMSIDSVN